jgi:pilus assembly protein CpaF
MTFSVIIHEKGGQPRRQEFIKSEVTIGRVQGNDIVLPKQNVSKRHSRIVLKNGKFVITDLKSTNGTYVNGRKISTPAVIKETDKIYIGDFVLSTELGDSDQAVDSMPATMTPPPPPPGRPLFAPGGMPAKTIASGVSPYAHENTPKPGFNNPAPPVSMPVSPPAVTHQAASSNLAKHENMTPPPPAPSGSPFSQLNSPPSSMPVNSSMADPDPFNAATSFQSNPPAMPKVEKEVSVSVPTPALVAPPATAVKAATPSSSAVPAFKPSVPAFQAPAAPVAVPVAVPVATPVAALVASPIASLVASPIASPEDELDLSVIDGGEGNSILVQLHQKLKNGIRDKGLQLPKRYRPQQQLNSELLESAFDILQEVGGNHSEDDLRQVIDEALSVGALHTLIEDDQIQSIYLNGAHHLAYVQNNGKVSIIRTPFSSIEQARRAASRILNGLGGQGDSYAQGRLGDFKALVDMNGSEGPYIVLQRAVNYSSLSTWVEEGRFDQNVATEVKRILNAGGKIAIVSPKTNTQAQTVSAIALSCLKSKRTISIGVAQHLGNESSWLTLPADTSSLTKAFDMLADCLVIGDQVNIDGPSTFEALSTASSAILMLTARSVNTAIKKMQRRAQDPELLQEAIECILFMQQDQHQRIYLSEAYNLERKETFYQATRA